MKAVRRPENFIQFGRVAHFNWLESFAPNSFDIEKLIRNLWCLSVFEYNKIIEKQARKSSEDTQVAGYARFGKFGPGKLWVEKVWTQFF